MKTKPSFEEIIEIGLNIIAQDLIWKKHTEKQIKNYINRFKLQEEKS